MKYLINFFVFTLSIFLGVTAALTASDGIKAYQLALAATQERQLEEQERARQEQLAMQTLHAQQQAQEAQRLQAQALERLEAERKEQEQQRLQEERARHHRKEAAWREFWQPSESCRERPVQVICADQHIRARKVFEMQYTDSSL